MELYLHSSICVSDTQKNYFPLHTAAQVIHNKWINTRFQHSTSLFLDRCLCRNSRFG